MLKKGRLLFGLFSLLICLVLTPLSKTSALDVNPRYIDFNGNQYEYYSKVKSKEATWRHTAYNKNSSRDQTITYTVSRTKYVRGSVKTSADFSLMKTSVGVSAEVGVGKSSKESVSMKFVIPTRKNATLEYGSEKVATTGYIVTYSRGNAVSKKTINGNWTNRSYSYEKVY